MPYEYRIEAKKHHRLNWVLIDETPGIIILEPKNLGLLLAFGIGEVPHVKI